MVPGASLIRVVFAALAVASVLAACSDDQPDGSPVATAQAQTVSAAGADFDFWVLSLSWSPSYCEAEGEDANRQQCGAGRSYAFILHGLWPQYERGWPEHCETDQPLDVDGELMRGMYRLMPSSGLIRHQWRKHGTCSGLTQEEYFALARRAHGRVAIPRAYRTAGKATIAEPDAVEDAFIAANPGLPSDGIAVTCDERRLREVRICLSKDLTFRACPEVNSRACRLDRAAMPASRGG